jgi:hypothetical protein
MRTPLSIDGIAVEQKKGRNQYSGSTEQGFPDPVRFGTHKQTEIEKTICDLTYTHGSVK